MNKQDLIAKIAKDTDLSKTSAGRRGLLLRRHHQDAQEG
jgi:hypothetical protein